MMPRSPAAAVWLCAGFLLAAVSRAVPIEDQHRQIVMGSDAYTAQVEFAPEHKLEESDLQRPPPPPPFQSVVFSFLFAHACLSAVRRSRLLRAKPISFSSLMMLTLGSPLWCLRSPPVIDMSDKTIFQILNDSLRDERHKHHHEPEPHMPPPPPHHGGPLPPPPLHLFAKFLNFSENTELFGLLDDTEASLSLLAPDDFALRRILPPHGHHHDQDAPPPPPFSASAEEEEEEADFQAFWGDANGVEESQHGEDSVDLFAGEASFDLSNVFTELLDNHQILLEGASSTAFDGARLQRLKKFMWVPRASEAVRQDQETDLLCSFCLQRPRHSIPHPQQGLRRQRARRQVYCSDCLG